MIKNHGANVLFLKTTNSDLKEKSSSSSSKAALPFCLSAGRVNASNKAMKPIPAQA